MSMNHYLLDNSRMWVSTLDVLERARSNVCGCMYQPGMAYDIGAYEYDIMRDMILITIEI